MANKIQVKRSTTTTPPTGLANGELAYTSNGEILFIGHPDGSTGSIAIGGRRVPGTLTANQALVANSTSGIDKVIVANLTPTQIYANGAVGSAGQILTSGATGNVYWGAAPSGTTDITDSANATTVTIISSTGADAVLDSANSTTAGILTSADWTKLNNMPANSVAGSDTQVMFNNNGVLAGDAGFIFVTTTDALTLGGAAQTTSPLFRVANSTTSANLSSATLTIGTSVVNATAVAAGANVFLNTTTLFAGNSTINASHTSSLLQVANSTSTANLTAAGLTIGTVIANTTGLFVGANVFANSSAFDVGNTIIASALLTLGGQINANGGVGTAGQVLTSGAAGNVYWTTPTTGTVTSVTGGNGLTGSVSTTGSLDVGAGNGISVAADSVSVNGGSTLTVNTTGVHVNTDLSITNLTLSGNLDINGTLTTVDTTNLSVTDSIISLARANALNTLDIGFYGTYNDGATKYSGLFRDATDGVYKLFAGQIPEPTTTVDTANVNFAYATLQTFLTTGALVANSTVVNITANSTVSVALTANTLSLSTALPATSGGTGTGSYTSGDLLVANTGNTLSKLSLGTDGKVLQSNGTAVVYADLDGGTF
jgi:hypothetical protein